MDAAAYLPLDYASRTPFRVLEEGCRQAGLPPAPAHALFLLVWRELGYAAATGVAGRLTRVQVELLRSTLEDRLGMKVEELKSEELKSDGPFNPSTFPCWCVRRDCSWKIPRDGSARCSRSGTRIWG